MNKKDLIADMKRSAGGSFIPRAWLAEYLHLKDPKSVDRYISGLPRLNGRYFIDDVAERMMSECDYRR